MTSVIGRCVADGSQGSCPMITSVHSRQFVSSIWTAMLVKEIFLHRIVTGDKSWVYHYKPESKRQSMQWKHPSSPANKKFKTQHSAGKVMLTIFWDVNGSILVHFQEKGQTVTSDRYSDMLVNELKPMIWSKRRGLLSKRILLLQDNTHPHTATHTVDTPGALKFEVLKRPPYSPDLAPSDFHLFAPMKEQLWGQKFADDNEVMEAVQSWLKATPKSFPRGHPQACGQVDQLCCEAGGLCQKIRHKQFL